MNEREILKLVRKHFNNRSAVSMLDDCGYFSPKVNSKIVLSTDTVIEDIHFLYHSNIHKSLPYKAIGASISDIISSGGTPKCILISLNINKNDNKTLQWYSDLFHIFNLASRELNVNIVGGNTTITDNKFSIGITAVGEQLNSEKSLLRSGIKSGDYIFVSGSIGDYWAGLQLIKKSDKANKYFVNLNDEKTNYLINKYDIPPYNLNLVNHIKSIANSCSDVSDALLLDLYEMLYISKNTLVLDINDIPISGVLSSIINKNFYREAVLNAATGGGDYELLFSVPEDKLYKLNFMRKTYGLNITCLGRAQSYNADAHLNNLIVKDKDDIFKLKHLGFMH